MEGSLEYKYPLEQSYHILLLPNKSNDNTLLHLHNFPWTQHILVLAFDRKLFLRAGAILFVKVPATIITSDCLGEALGAAPNLSRSYLGIEVCIISTAQHARPNVIQCKDPVLAQLIKLSVDVVIKPFSAKSFAKSLNSSGYLFVFQNELIFIPILKLLFSIHK